MLDQPAHRNYLSRLAFSDSAPAQKYHKVNLVARALYPDGGVKKFASMQVRIVSINETGAIVQARDIGVLPDHFYLCLGKREIFLTCSKKRQQDASAFVMFSKPEATAFIMALKKLDFPLATLQELKGRSSAVIEARIYNPANNNAV